MSQWQWLRSFVDRPNFSVPNSSATRPEARCLRITRAPYFQPLERMLQFAMPDGGGADHQRAVGNGVGHALVLLGVGQHLRRADGGARLAKSDLVGIHHPQVEKAEVAHGARRRTDVERIARAQLTPRKAGAALLALVQFMAFSELV